MHQEKIKLDLIKQFTNSLDIRDGKIITQLVEDDFFEFKKTLHVSQHGISKEYLKTIAGLANNRGGVIIFGIEPDTQELVGINEKYENLDNRYINMIVSEFLDGLSSFYFFTQRHSDKLIGFLKINEPIFKPVIVKSNFKINDSNHIAGDIYYRYPGEVLKIKPSDLRNLMSKEINRHAQQLIKQINTLVEIGPENAAIINSKTGEIDANNSKLMLSPEILNELNLIMEGQFVEKDGAPAYIIKGNIELESGEAVSNIIREKVHSTLHNRDYHFSLLDNECSEPLILLKEIVYRDTYYLPIFNLISKAKVSIHDAIEVIGKNETPDVKKTTKSKIIERLTNPETCLSLRKQGTIKEEISETEFNGKPTIEGLKEKYQLKGNVDKTIVRTLLYNQICQLINVDKLIKIGYLKEYIEAFSHLSKEQLMNNQEYYCKEFKTILIDFGDNLGSDGSSKTAFRKTICLMDFLLYSPN